jgi:hypothetical protein
MTFDRDKYYFPPVDQAQAKIDALINMEEDTLLAKSLEIEKSDRSIPDGQLLHKRLGCVSFNG